MQDYIYSVIAFIAMVIHLIINFNMITGRARMDARAAREYRVFLAGVFAYYIIDAGWGILAGLGWTRILYVDTMFYYLAISVSVLLWNRAVVAYLDFGKFAARVLHWFGYGLLAMYIVLVIANIFNECLFYFDVHGNYVAGPLRLLLFYPLVGLNVLMAALVFIRVLGTRDSIRHRNMVVLMFCLTMAGAIIFQIVWPLWSFYALGCLIGNCFVHIFLVEDIRAELRRTVIERAQTASHMVELEKALERAQAAEKARSMFFSIVSHDIRTPLNAILGYSELLQYGVKDQAEKDEALRSIRASGTTLLQLVNDVLDLAKLDAGKMTLLPEPVRLSDLTDEVLSSFRLTARDKGIELVNRTAEVPTVMLDEHRFRQILFNLIGNAVKFTAHGSVTVAAAYTGTNLEVSVSDTGCGIAPDMLKRILDPFVQVRDPSHSADRSLGTGLGLSICSSLVEVMGGKLVVESELGKGSTFRIRIPNIATVAGKDIPAPAPKVSAVVKPPEHVLVVDDSPVNRAVLTAFLKKAGVVSIDHAADGVEALAALDAAAKAGQPYDFILSDLWMPNMNGLEFVEKLREDPRFVSLPCFALTADTESQTDVRTKLFTGILLKPLTYDKLMGTFAAMDRS